MKTMRRLRTAGIGGGVFLGLCLAFSGPAFSQVYGPFVAPPVRITSPVNHATFYAPVDIPIFAYARDPGFQVNYTNLEFYVGTNELGHGIDLGSANPFGRPVYANFVFSKPFGRLRSLYCFVWSNAPPGSYDLTAVAGGSNSIIPGSMVRTSAPVNIIILASSTNSNPLDTLSIVATDPVAAAGTNLYWFWRGETNVLPAWTNWPPPSWKYYTNWGPKNALFTVRRFGDASASVTANLKIGGTASNGVDYATLTNSVTIPSGEAYALIPVVPIDNGSTNPPKTVVVTLLADTNSPPEFRLGLPASAAAVVVEEWPRPLPFLLPDGCFHLNASGPDGGWFCVQSSTDLVNWSCLSTNQVLQGAVDFVDPHAPGQAREFYRAVPLDGAPLQ